MLPTKLDAANSPCPQSEICFPALWSLNLLLFGLFASVTSGQTYEAYMRTHIFDPVGMTDTYTVADETRLPRMAIGCRHVEKRLEPSPTISESFGWAAGNVVSTLADLAKWNAALRSGKVISKADYGLMSTSVRTSQGDAGYGLGLFVDDVDGQPRVGHTGGSFGFTTANEYFPKQDLQVIAFTNNGDDTPEPGEILTQIVFEDLYPRIAEAARKPSPGADPSITPMARAAFVSLQNGEDAQGAFSPNLAAKLKSGLGEIEAKQFIGYGAPTAVIFKGARVANGLKWSDYLLQFGPGCALKFGIGLGSDGKIASFSFG
ncbi:serine hydrolase domain-containing protein [Phenylobacterium sp.]|uniref:serine hydrolase domain-containing protein n=1 Tax=Phenylobacterium sp. TaxID=1871053 RepID=UPI00356A0149